MGDTNCSTNGTPLVGGNAVSSLESVITESSGESELSE